MVQHNVIRFISTIKEKDSLPEACEKLELETLADRHSKIRHALLLHLLSNDEQHESLTSAYDKLINDRPTNAAIIRAVSQGNSPMIYVKKPCAKTVFLPKIVRETKA